MGGHGGEDAVIIGADSGAGRAVRLLFAREGAAVACVENDTTMGEEIAALIRT